MLLARTDPDAAKHRGLTYFLMDMEQDGVEIRPLRQITGEAEFNELFIEEARIPDENIVGGENNGWSVAITTLMHERAGLAFALQVTVQIALRELLDRAREAGRRRRPGDAPALRPGLRRGAGAAADRLPRADEAAGARRAGARGLARQVALGRGQPVADRARARPRRAARPARRRPVDLPLPARPRQLDRGRDDRDPQEHRRRARARAAAGRNELRPLRGPAGHQAHRARVPRRPLQARGGAAARAGGGARVHRRAVGGDRRARLARAGGRRSRGLGIVELAVVAEELGYALRADAAAVHVGGGAAARRRRRGGAARGRQARHRRAVGRGHRRRAGPLVAGRGRCAGVKIAVPDAASRRPDRGHRGGRAALRRRRRGRRDRAGRDARHHAAARHRAARRRRMPRS